MLARRSYFILRQLPRFPRAYRDESTATEGTQRIEDRDPAPYFFDRETYFGLKKLTRVNYERVFRARRTGEPLKRPVYKFMTDEQLQQYRRRAEAKANQFLQMPPVVKKRVEINTIYHDDPELEGLETSKIAFTDITYGISDKERLIAVREPNGVLRAATWNERQRLNQTYFPMPFREIETPKMFQDVNLKLVLDRKEYEFILDRACVQFDPDDPEYHRITETVYEHMNKSGDFNAIRSTRHFGPFVFHLLWTKAIDDLLSEILLTNHGEEAELLVYLYYKIHPSEDMLVKELQAKGGIEFVECYAYNNAAQPQKVQDAVIKYKQYLMEKV